MTRVYLDSCIVIYLIQGPDSVRSALRQALQATQACFSALTRLECRVRPLRERASELLAEFDRFFQSRNLRRCRLTGAVYEMATELRASHGVKTPDALHLAAAIQARCEEFWTNDHRLPSAIHQLIRVRVLP